MNIHGYDVGDYPSGIEFKAADFKKWSKRDLWSLGEAISLILGYEPVLEMDRFDQKIKTDHRTILATQKLAYCTEEITTVLEFADQFLERHNVLTEAKALKLLKPIAQGRFYLKDILERVEEKGYEIPAELKSILKAPSSIQKNKSQSSLQDSTDHLSVFREMEGLSSNEITLVFLADNIIKVSARKKDRRVSYEALDLFDRRKGKTNQQGAILLGIAQGKKPKKSSAKVISRIREMFKSKLGVKDGPFQTDWTPRFSVKDKRTAKDERAKKKAIHIPYDDEHEHPFDKPESNDPAAQYLLDADTSD